MLDYIFEQVDNVHFHVGEYNLRSQRAVSKLGAAFLGKHILTIDGVESLEMLYLLTKDAWLERRKA